MLPSLNVFVVVVVVVVVVSIISIRAVFNLVSKVIRQRLWTGFGLTTRHLYLLGNHTRLSDAAFRNLGGNKTRKAQWEG